MVSQRESLISSGITAGIVTGSHAVAHYTFGNPESFAAAGATEAGVVVFATTFTISYLGMQGYLPF